MIVVSAAEMPFVFESENYHLNRWDLKSRTLLQTWRLVDNFHLLHLVLVAKVASPSTCHCLQSIDARPATPPLVSRQSSVGHVAQQSMEAGFENVVTNRCRGQSNYPRAAALAASLT